jgi:hypothetical protein
MLQAFMCHREKQARRNGGSGIVVPAIRHKSPKSRNGTTAQSSLFDFQAGTTPF